MVSPRKSIPITAETKDRPSVAKRIRAICRDVLGFPNNCNTPIVVDDNGTEPPAWAGKRYHHTNASGDIIRHPSAYRRAYGKPIYVASTRHVTVGLLWLQAYELAPEGEVWQAITDYAIEMKEGVIS